MQSRSGDTYWRDLDKPGGTDLAAPHTAGSAGLYQLPTAEQELHAASSVAAVPPVRASINASVSTGVQGCEKMAGNMASCSGFISCAVAFYPCIQCDCKYCNFYT